MNYLVRSILGDHNLQSYNPYYNSFNNSSYTPCNQESSSSEDSKELLLIELPPEDSEVNVNKKIEDTSQNIFQKTSPLLLTSGENVGFDYLPPVKAHEVFPSDIMVVIARHDLKLFSIIGQASKKGKLFVQDKIEQLPNQIDFSKISIKKLKDVHWLSHFLGDVKCEKIEKIIFPVEMIKKNHSLKNVISTITNKFPNVREFSLVSGSCDRVLPSLEMDFSFISNWPLLETIDLSGQDNIRNIDWLWEALQLKSFNANGCNQIVDFSVLKEFENLVSLDLENCYPVNIDFVESLKNLENLNLKGWKVLDYSKLSRLTNLKTLNLSNSWFGDVQLLAPLDKLEELDLSDIKTKIKNVEDLKLLKNLKKLNLQHIKIKKQPGFLGELPNLEELSINRISLAKIMLPAMKKLKFLDLSWLSAFDIQLAEPLNCLVKIDLSNSELGRDLKFLNLMPNLEDVNLENMDLRNVSLKPCLDLRGLRRLNLAGSVRYASPKISIPKCDNLRELNLKGCDWVKDVEFLEQLPNLYAINLKGVELPYRSKIEVDKYPKLKLVEQDWWDGSLIG